MVLVSPPVKICDFFFFFTTSVSDPSVPCRSHVGEAKKKKKNYRTPKFGASYLFRCLTRVGHQQDAKNGMTVQPRLLVNILGFDRYL